MDGPIGLQASGLFPSYTNSSRPLEDQPISEVQII